MSNLTKVDGGASTVLAFINIELHKDGSCIVQTNLNDPVVFARVMGDALSIKMNQIMEQAQARAALAKMQHPLSTKLAALPKGN